MSALPLRRSRDARRDVRHDAEGHRLERGLAAPVLVVGLQHGLHALLPRGEAIGAAADGREVEGLVAHLLDDGLGHDGELHELRHQRRVGRLGLHDDLGALGLRRHDLVELRELRALERRVDDARDREGDVGRGQRRAVVEGHAVPDVELDRRVVGVAPGRGDLRHDLAADVAGDEVVEDVAVDRVAVGVPLDVRIERRGVVGQVDGERVLALRGRGAGEEGRGDETCGEQDPGEGVLQHGNSPQERDAAVFRPAASAQWRAMSACVANHTSPLALARRMTSSRMKMRERWPLW